LGKERGEIEAHAGLVEQPFRIITRGDFRRTSPSPLHRRGKAWSPLLFFAPILPLCQPREG
jgi:hypothetical protein